MACILDKDSLTQWFWQSSGTGAQMDPARVIVSLKEKNKFGHWITLNLYFQIVAIFCLEA